MSKIEKPSMPELRLLKGTVDYPPAAQMRRQRAMDVCRAAFEAFGFSPLETPILSPFDVLALKYGEGDPILEEIFHVTDRGERELGLRYDLTVPFCRYVGMALKQQMPLPFKRYEIGRVFRDGPVKEGRVREFAQCDADMVGSADPAFDAECLAIGLRVMAELGIDGEIELNNRKILWGLLEEAGLPTEQRDAATVAVDKWEKVPREAVRDELEGLGVSRDQIERVFSLLEQSGGVDIIESLKRQLNSDAAIEGFAELEASLEAAVDFGVDMERIRITPRLARGLGIYTGTIYELFCRDRELMSSSLGSGGRYDKIVGEFLHPDEPDKQWDYPCVGISFGIEPIAIVLEKLEGEARKQTVIDALVVPMGTRRESLKLVASLRSAGVRADIWLAAARLKKIFKRADQQNIPFIIILGEDELKDGEATLRDMQSGEQTRVKLETAAADIATRIRANRQ